MKKYMEKIYLICIIFVIAITFIEEFASLKVLMEIKTILLIILVGVGIFLARGLLLYMSIFLLSIGHILALKYRIGSEIWLEGITKNLPLATLFVVVPILYVPIKLGGYLETINFYIGKHLNRSSVLFSIMSSFIFIFGSITNLGAVRILHSLLEEAKFPSKFLATILST